MKTRQSLILVALLSITIGVSFLLPKEKYSSLNILSRLNIPSNFYSWRSIDVSKELNLKDDRYNFISNAFARLYQNKRGQSLLFLILDAGNFHNPKVCYGSSGFNVKELDDTPMNTSNTTFKATALSMERKNDTVYMIYWLCIDKKITNWTNQKIAELWSKLSNRKKAGLMIRLEIPSNGKNQEQSLTLGRDFIEDLSKNLSEEDNKYLFGK